MTFSKGVVTDIGRRSRSIGTARPRNPGTAYRNSLSEFRVGDKSPYHSLSQTKGFRRHNSRLCQLTRGWVLWVRTATSATALAVLMPPSLETAGERTAELHRRSYRMRAPRG